MMIFKTRKIPRHLIIRDDYEGPKKGRFGFFALILGALLLAGMTYTAIILELV
ncbi:MAG: hypothetical protein RQ899_05105 [Pseudomonadales bacterium]|nr:hypothetical protein [Pseudomonadales bacterium]